MKTEPVKIDNHIIEKTMRYGETPVLHYKIEYPEFLHGGYRYSLEPINQWYRRQAGELQFKYETEVYTEAVKLLAESKMNDFPFHMFEAISVYETTYNQNGMLSLFYDHYTYTGGAHGGTNRVSDTWNIKGGCSINLYQFTTNPTRFREEILASVNTQIADQIANGEGMYFDNYVQLTAETFNPENYYLTPEGLAVFYQQYDIAPYASGIPVFII